MKPSRLLDVALLPGRPVPPLVSVYCRSCEEVTSHAGMTGDRGEELGTACLWCGTMVDRSMRVICPTCRGDLQTCGHLMRAWSTGQIAEAHRRLYEAGFVDTPPIKDVPRICLDCGGQIDRREDAMYDEEYPCTCPPDPL
jgi:hypothetical protein